MAKLSDFIGAAVKAAGFTVSGTAPTFQGDRSGTGATELTSFDPVMARELIDGMSAADLYATQPHLRTVVSFVARNGAQLGRHMYAKDAAGDRERITKGSAVDLLSKPNEYMSGYDLFNMLLSELALYDFAMWVPRMDENGDWKVDPIPVEWIIGVKSKDAFRQEAYKIQPTGATAWYFVNASDAVIFRGYGPHGFKAGSSAVVSLRDTLSEQVSAMTFRKQLWQRGGRVGMFMSRPADAPTWSKEAKEKFVQNWRNTWSGNGSNAGSTPLLEDGMELKRIGFTAKEEQWIEAATLALTTVAAAYHVPPAMVGVSGYNSFASVKEFRKMLYTETLGPLIAQVEDTFNTFLLPMIGAPEGQYLELNIAEKLQGDFEEQATQLFQAVGGPYMTPNEARSKTNMPPIEGGDVLLAPLNMGAAGNSGPEADATIDSEATETDPAAETPPADPVKAGLSVVSRDHASRVKAPANSAPSFELDLLAVDLKKFFIRQQKATQAKLGATKKADPEWWNQKAWNQELSAVLQPHMASISAGVARKAAGANGLDPDAYSVGQTANFLKAVADSRADLVNSTTRDRIKAAVQAGNADTLAADVDHVFTEAIETRAPVASKTMGTMLAGWAVTEMARQLLSDKSPQKTWLASGLANSRHAGMNGETVSINEKFSNGANWPGDPVLGADEVANCGCGVEITY